MSSPIQKPRTAADEEAALLDAADEIMEKSAATAVAGGEAAVPARREFIADDPDRFEDRPEPSPDEEEEEEKAPVNTEWMDSPSVRNQAELHPDTVRMADPETKVFDISDAEQLKEFNTIQKGVAHPTAPTHAITEIDKETIKGSWVVTFYRIQYQKLI